MESEKEGSIALEFATREDFFRTMSEAPPDGTEGKTDTGSTASPRTESSSGGSSSAGGNTTPPLGSPGKLQKHQSTHFVKNQTMPRSLTLHMPSSGVAKGRTSVPAVADIGSGCYLLFDKAEDLFYLQWSEEALPGALGWCSPAATVPKFKYKVNGGKQILFREFSKDRQNYFRAWAQFIKMANEFRTKLMIMEEVDAGELPPVKLFALELAVAGKGSGEAESKVYELTDRLVLHDLKNVKSIIAVPDTCISVSEGSSMTSEFFEKVGTNDGGSTRLA